jgi:hypothetical protein
MAAGLTNVRYFGMGPSRIQKNVGWLYVEMNELQVHIHTNQQRWQAVFEDIRCLFGTEKIRVHAR